MKKAVLVAFDRFTDVDIFLAWDMLNRVKNFDPAFQVKILGTEPFHTSNTGLPLAMHGFVEECAEADLVYFGSGPLARHLVKDAAYLRRFRLNPERQIICSMCSGSLIIGALGHLKGLPATTYPTVFENLADFDVDVQEDKHLVTEGNIGTAAGCLAAVDLMSWAIEKLYDRDISDAATALLKPLGEERYFI